MSCQVCLGLPSGPLRLSLKDAIAKDRPGTERWGSLWQFEVYNLEELVPRKEPGQTYNRTAGKSGIISRANVSVCVPDLCGRSDRISGIGVPFSFVPKPRLWKRNPHIAISQTLPEEV